MKAAAGGHCMVLKLLLEAGSPWNTQDVSGYCAGWLRDFNQALD